VTASSASNRVNRGGNFNNTAVNLRAGNRNNNTPSNANNNIGLRCMSPRKCRRIAFKDAIRVRKVRDQPPSSCAGFIAGRRAPAASGWRMLPGCGLELVVNAERKSRKATGCKRFRRPDSAEQGRAATLRQPV